MPCVGLLLYGSGKKNTTMEDGVCLKPDGNPSELVLNNALKDPVDVKTLPVPINIGFLPIKPLVTMLFILDMELDKLLVLSMEVMIVALKVLMKVLMDTLYIEYGGISISITNGPLNILWKT